MSRKEQEKAEGLDVTNNKVPDNKYQTEQQTQDTQYAENVKTPNTSFTNEKVTEKGSELKQEAVAKVISNDAGAPGMGISAAGRRGSSGSNGGVLGAANATPKADKSRSDSRYGKKLDRIGTKINFTPSEQVLVNYDEAKPLADAANDDQGYNGTYRNEYARSQKVSGNVPGELLFDRSVDMIFKDELYFSEGQYVKQTGVVTDDDPTVKAESNENGEMVYPIDASGHTVYNYSNPSGNYLHRAMKFTLNSDGSVSELEFDVTDLTPQVDAETANRASAAALIDRNSAEIDREVMDSKAGDEKSTIWSCLPRAIRENTQVIQMLKDYEAETASEILVGYGKTGVCQAYQLNRAVKDGQELVSPAVDALTGLIFDTNNNSIKADENVYPTLASILEGNKAKALFNAGCSSLMIAAYDSVKKYNTKQDIILQPRGFRMHLQTADNNMNVFRTSDRFVQAYKATECYSTIDREYDPMMPICATDKAGLIHRRSMQQMCGFIPNALKSFTFHSDVSGSTEFDYYRIAAKSFLNPTDPAHVHVLISDNSAGHGAFTFSGHTFTPNNAMDADVKVVVIINNSSEVISSKTIDNVTYYEQQDPVKIVEHNGHEIFVAVPKNADDVVTAFSYAVHGGPYVYTYSDLRNYYVLTVDFPLVQGLLDYLKLEIGSKFYSLLGDNKTVTVPMIHSTQYYSLWSLMLCAATPYIQNVRKNSMRDVIYYEDNIGQYPFSGLTDLGHIGIKSYTNFKFNGYDEPLETNVMNATTAMKWIMPEMFWVAGQKTNANKGISETTVVMPFYMSQENFVIASDGSVSLDSDAAAMSMPSIRSGARLAYLDKFYGISEKDIRLSYDCAVPFIPDKADTAFSYKYSTNGDGIIGFILKDTEASIAAFADITIAEWLTVPRELGWIIDAPYGLLTPKITGGITIGTTPYCDYASMNESATRGSSFRIKYWLGDDATSHTTGSVSQDILKAKAVNINRAANFKQQWFEVVANGKSPTVDHGMLFSFNRLFASDGSAILGESSFIPFYNDAAHSTGASCTVVSLMKAFWTRIQKLPFAVSPFEGGDITKGSASATNSKSYDPYELCYYFGLCGFRASDYRESIYNREKEVVNKGYLFVNDPWIVASPIFKDGSIASEVTVSQGYTV